MPAPARTPFAAKMHVALVIVMIASFLLITQRASKAVYQLGFGLLVVSTLVQIVFGNIPPEAGLRQSARTLTIGLLIVAAVFGIGAAITPTLVNLGR